MRPTSMCRTRIRSAEREDLPELIALISTVVPDCLPETVWQLPWHWQDYVVAEGPKGLEAAGSLQPVDGGTAEIRGICVHPEHRGRGLASSVVEELVHRAERRGLRAVCVTRKPAFFERLGFRETPTTWMRVERRLYSKPGPARVGMQREAA